MLSSSESAWSGSWPETVIVRHRKERKSKCSLQPLSGRPGFRFLTYPLREAPPLDGYVRLALGGPPLAPKDHKRGLLLLDATWRLVEPMHRIFQHVEARTLPTFVTAYPRVSKVFDDPRAGLASIEALYVAYRILGRPAEELLSEYYGRELFLEQNKSALARLAGEEW